MRVSISEQRDTVWENMREEEGGEERDGPTERKDSFLMPAINFARRMSMKLTGSRGDHDCCHHFFLEPEKPNKTEYFRMVPAVPQMPPE